MAYGAHVQSLGVDSGIAQGASLAFPLNLTLGNSLVVAVRYSGNPGTVTCTDSLGHTFSVVEQASSTTLRVYTWYVGSCLAGEDIVSLTSVNAVPTMWVIGEFEGASTLGVDNSGTGSSNTLSSGNLVVSAASALLIGAGASSSLRSFTPGASFTEHVEVEQRFAVESRVVAGAATYTASATLSSTDTWTMVGLALYPSASGVLYTATVGGVIAPVSTVLSRGNKVLVSTLTPVGRVVKQVGKGVSGGIAVVGATLCSTIRHATLSGLVGIAGGTAYEYIDGSLALVRGLFTSLRRRRRR